MGYFADLGVGALYLSPFLRSRRGSTHGYDTVDHGEIDPAVGTEDEFRALATAARERGMGLVLDIVPNHMSIDDPRNGWWQNVLENGQCSPFANYFDIDWTPPKVALQGKVLLAFLGDQFGKVLEDQQTQLVYQDQRFMIRYYERLFPTDPRSWALVLRAALEQLVPVLEQTNPQRMELESVITALEHLPERSQVNPEAIQQRHRENDVARRRLSVLLQASREIREALAGTLESYNGTLGDPHSFDRLEAFLNEQAYRLCYWRVATDEINYRRFFDVDTLAAIRVEDDAVFEGVHALPLKFVAEGHVSGLRIDHADGLLDPQAYLAKLDNRAREAATSGPRRGLLNGSGPWMLVEKILSRDERLPADWPVAGTTGYNFLNLVNGLFVDRQGWAAIRDAYQKFTGQNEPFERVLYGAKRTILSSSLSSELYVLSSRLVRIAEQHRWSRDFTRASLFRALREVVACFPVYRTYTRPGSAGVSEEDRKRIRAAVRLAKRWNPAMSPSFFDFIASVLLLEAPDGLSEAVLEERREFVLKFQQVTGPVTAKGMEDTAFYRYYPLASLDEVGGNPLQSSVTVDRFHEVIQDRLANWPQEMSATGTHDTKRGEDLRARLNVLSEIPAAWEAAVGRWHAMNAQARRAVDDELVAAGQIPDANEEYLIYQTLVGLWPVLPPAGPGLDEAGWSALVERLLQYAEKAFREAKVHTSWLNPEREYEDSVQTFIKAILADRQSEFLQDLDALVRSIAHAGFVNSLSQLLIKIGAPGVPDFYQGVEFWDFNLVDPDNRRPVDYAARRRALTELIDTGRSDLGKLSGELLSHWPDERLKLLVTWRGLQCRREHPDLFSGHYQALPVTGARKANTCAFARVAWPQWAICAVPRLAVEAWCGVEQPHETSRDGTAGGWIPGRWWRETVIELPADAPRRWRDAITGRAATAQPQGDTAAALDVGELFTQFPVALLISEPE